LIGDWAAAGGSSLRLWGSQLDFAVVTKSEEAGDTMVAGLLAIRQYSGSLERSWRTIWLRDYL